MISFETGFYSRREAARLLHATPKEISNWIRDYLKTRPDGSEKVVGAAVETSVRDYGALTFAELIELRYVKRFRQAGISLQKIRQAAERGRLSGTAFPFTGKRWATLFKKLIDARAFEDAVTGERFLAIAEEAWDDLDIDEQGVARQWFPLGKDKQIVLNPQRLHGAPTISNSRVRTDTIYGQFLAVNRDARAVANWFGIDEQAVRDAVEFEEVCQAA